MTGLRLTRLGKHFQTLPDRASDASRGLGGIQPEKLKPREPME